MQPDPDDGREGRPYQPGFSDGASSRSEDMQIRVASGRPIRAERTTTSCGECRRRKQKVPYYVFCSVWLDAQIACCFSGLLFVEA
jgi:hypothetical protein